MPSFGGPLKNRVAPLLPELVIGLARTMPNHVAFFGQARQGLLVLVQHLLSERPSLVFVVPAYTCSSVPNAIEQGGGRCVFVDVDDTLDFDYADLNEQIANTPPEDIVLIATLLFGAPVRNYKNLFPSALVIEDRSQSFYDRERRADYQILSFGAGKLLSLGGGGAVVGRQCLPSVLSQCPKEPIWYLPVTLLRTVIQDQLFKRGWIYGLIEPLVMRLLERTTCDGAILPVRMQPLRARWAWYAMQRVPLVTRQEIGKLWFSSLPPTMCFQVEPDTPWLRMPVKLLAVPEDVMAGGMYWQTVDKSERQRGKVLQGAQQLLKCYLLPVHRAVPLDWLRLTGSNLKKDLSIDLPIRSY